MSDISVGRSSSKNGIKNASKSNGEYSKLKKEYDAFIKNAAKSDLANSPTLKGKELELLSALEIAAEKEGKTDEVKKLSARKTELLSVVNSQQDSTQAAYYKPVSFKGSINIADYGKKLEQYADSRGFIDENAQKIISAFEQQGNDDAYHVSYLLKKCRDDNEQISSDKVEAVEVLANAGVSPMFVSSLLEEFSKSDENFNEHIDLSLCSKMADFKAMGFDDFDSLLFTRLLQKNFTDEEAIKSLIKTMTKSKISPDTVVKILDVLSVNDTAEGGKKVSPSAVKSVISLKKALSIYRNNEKAERDNPINKLNVMTFKMGDTVLIMKGNEVKYITPTEGETVHNLKKEYEDLISKIEDNMLVEFASKYKDKNGEIDSKYIRTMTALRQAGIPYDSLFEMMDFCLQDGSINKEKINTISLLKSSGALGVDIPGIIDAAEKTSDGKYSSEDIKNACDLTSSVISGKEVCALLPHVRGKENVKEFFMDFSPFFETKPHLLEMLPLIKNEEGVIDENAMDVLYNLAENFLVSENDAMTETDFVSTAKKIISASMNNGEGTVNDDAAGICSIMCQNRENPEDILKGLELCKTNNGNVDEQLAEILWDMSLSQASIDEIADVIDACKYDNGVVIRNMSNYLISMFDSGADKDKVMKLVKKLNEI